MSFEFPIRVYYEDTDLAGIVYYANYFKYIERGRTEALRARGIDQMAMKETSGVVFAVRSLTADFRKPAKMDDQLVVTTQVTSIQKARITMAQEVLRDGDVLFAAEVILVALNGSGRPVRVPEALHAL